ncbi:MAG: hypothetical protein CMO55_23720 [Verrucomicrobiales bacterium]|nr:hypothetical protein [Verrucomicrobiales bacterium]
MKKFVMILAGLAMLGAAVVGVLNKQDVEVINKDLDNVRAEVKTETEKLGELEDKRDDAAERETQAKDARNQAAAAVEGVKQNLKVIERALEDVSAELKTTEIKQKEIDLAVKKQFPTGEIQSVNDLEMRLTMLKETLTQKQNEKSTLNTQLTQAAEAKQVQVAKVQEEEKFQLQRAQKLALNGLEATIIAVNKEWGFVMINAGRQHGVSGDSSLLVKRGNTRIARLRIVNLEDSFVTADVVDESVVRGVEVQPGDRVIFENAR